MSKELRGWLWCDTGAVTSFAIVDGIPRHESSGTGQCIPWEIGARVWLSQRKKMGKNMKKVGKNGDKIGGKRKK